MMSKEARYLLTSGGLFGLSIEIGHAAMIVPSFLAMAYYFILLVDNALFGELRKQVDKL